MPGSSTSRDRRCARVNAHRRVAFRRDKSVGVPIDNFAAQWLAYAIPCRRFVSALAAGNARLGASADRYSFTAVDFHHLLLAGLPAHRHPLSHRAVWPTDRGIDQWANDRYLRIAGVHGAGLG